MNDRVQGVGKGHRRVNALHLGERSLWMRKLVPLLLGGIVVTA